MRDLEFKKWPYRGSIEFEAGYKYAAGIPWLFKHTYISDTVPKNWEQAKVMDDLFDLAKGY